MNKGFTLFLFVGCVSLMVACSSASHLFSKGSPREAYENKTAESGGKNNPALVQWRNVGEYSLRHPLVIQENYTEAGKYVSGDSTASSYELNLKRGQKISISFQKLSQLNLPVFLDLWKLNADREPELIAAADTTNDRIEYIASEDSWLIVRFEGVIGFSGNYNFNIQTGPSLLFPIAAGIKAPFGSYWGDGRDNGSRKHEGVDIMAPKHSPAVAAANGVVTQVGEDALGGKVVSMRPDGTNISLYYAHLDSQFVVYGQHVKTGDVLGLTGNTGNAQYTVSHLHFGIYTSNGAIDPLLFIKPATVKKPANLSFPDLSAFSILKTIKLYAAANKNAAVSDIEKNSVIIIRAVTDDFYRVALADGRAGFILKTAVRLK